jgi:hypothetical protein
MALIFCYIIAYIQILSAGFNLWGVDPRILLTMPVGRNMVFVVLFMLVQLLGLAGAILVLQKMRLGFVLSLAHHILLLPALVITGWGLVMLMDDRINVTLLFMSQPNSTDISLYWSLGWGTVFKQVTQNVPNGSTYVGINLFALGCAFMMWKVIQEADAAAAEHEMELRRRQRQARRPQQLALPPPQPQKQPQRMYQHQGAPKPRRMPRREY